MTFIPNSIDTGLLDGYIQAPILKKIEHLFNNNDILLAANRLHETKNTQSLISIYKNLSNRSKLKLLIIGEGAEENNLIKSICNAGLRYSKIDNLDHDDTVEVYLLSFQLNIHNLIHKSKFFLFPSRSEGTPLVLLEAMYCGIPVLASDCPNGGVFEVMQGFGTYDRCHARSKSEQTKAGFLMPIPYINKPDSILCWSNQLTYLLNLDSSELKAIGVGGRSIAADYDKESVRLKWLQTINIILQKKL